MFFKNKTSSFPLIWVSCLLFMACGPSLQEVVKETELSQAFEHNQDKIHSFRGVARVFFSLNNKKGSVEALVVSEKPDSLRIEISNFFGVPLSMLTIYKGKVTYYAIPEEKYYIGKTNGHDVKQFLPFALTEKDLFGLIYFSQKTFDRFKNKKLYDLEFYAVKEKEKEKLFYPQGFKLTDPKTKDKDRIEFRWDQYDLNPPTFSSMHFKLKKPPQAHLIDLTSSQVASPLFKADEEAE